MARISSSRYWFIQYGIGRRDDPARAHHLDAVRAHAQFLARGAQAFVDAVGDDAEHIAEQTAVAGACAGVAWGRFLRAHVAMAASHRERAPRVKVTRPADQSVGHRPRQRQVAAGHVAHGGKAAGQRMLQHAQGIGCAVGLAPRLLKLHRQGAGVGVDVAVDQPGHQGAAAGVDDGGARWCLKLRPDGLDAIAGHEHGLSGRAFGSMAVEDACVLDQQLRHGGLRDSRCEVARQGAVISHATSRPGSTLLPHTGTITRAPA
jgi:hypothetical protein